MPNFRQGVTERVGGGGGAHWGVEGRALAGRLCIKYQRGLTGEMEGKEAKQRRGNGGKGRHERLDKGIWRG